MTEDELEEFLSRPDDADVAAMKALKGDILILGVSGKMGPTLAMLARRASDQARTPRRILGVARFSSRGTRAALEKAGIETLAADLLDRASLDALPTVANVIYMAGQKFGTATDQPLTWATNVLAAGLAAERFARSRIVAFSTGNVYPLSPAGGPGPAETDPTGPVGEYAQSALGRERILAFCSARYQTPMVILRLNYAVEPRYGVLRDLADRIVRGEPVDLAMGHVNVIWQRDANAVALRALAQAAVPPLVLNLTGTRTLAVRDLAQRLGRRLGREPRFTGSEQPTALLSNASRSAALFGEPPMPVDQMIEQVADWVKAGGASLGKPTHFEEREGRF